MLWYICWSIDLIYPEEPLELKKFFILSQFVDEVGPTYVAPYPGRTRGALNILSHLPLHSQQLSRAPSLLIPIGGIHMIQPRSYLPLYSLVSSPTPHTANPPATGVERGESWRAGLNSPPKGRLLLQRQDTLQEAELSNRTSPQDPATTGETSGSSQSAGPPHREGLREGCFSIRELPSPGTETRWSPSDTKPSTLHTEATDAHVTERSVYPSTSQGQKTPSSPTQLW